MFSTTMRRITKIAVRTTSPNAARPLASNTTASPNQRVAGPLAASNRQGSRARNPNDQTRAAADAMTAYLVSRPRRAVIQADTSEIAAGEGMSSDPKPQQRPVGRFATPQATAMAVKATAPQRKA